MHPKEVVKIWIEAFNAADSVKLGSLYFEDAVNHQVANDPMAGSHGIAWLRIFSRRERENQISTGLLGQALVSKNARAARTCSMIQ